MLKGTILKEKNEELKAKEALARLGGGQKQIDKQHERGKLTRPGADRCAAGSGELHGDRDVRHPPVDQVRDGQGEVLRRRGGRRFGKDRRPAGLHLFAGFHGHGGLARQGARQQDLPRDGPGGQGRRPDHRPDRFGRRPDPGGARAVRLDLLPQHAGLRDRPAVLPDPGALRRRCGLFARPVRFRVHGRRDQQDAHHRAERDQGGDRRGDHGGGARRRQGPQPEERRRAPGGRDRAGVLRAGEEAAELSPVQLPGGAPRGCLPRRSEPADRGDREDHPGLAVSGPTT